MAANRQAFLIAGIIGLSTLPLAGWAQQSPQTKSAPPQTQQTQKLTDTTAPAQQDMSAAPPIFYAKPIQQKPYDPKNEYNAPETLSTPPDMPYLPPYPNPVKYESILKLNLKPGPAFSLHFDTKEEASELMNFYKEAAKQNKWQPLPNTSERVLSARKPGRMFSVTIIPAVKKTYKAQVYLVYQIYGKEND